MHQLALRETGYVGFPWVIHCLCADAGVALRPDEQKDVKMGKPLTRAVWDNYISLSIRAARLDDAPFPVIPPVVPPPPHTEAGPSSQPQPASMDELTHMMQSLLQGQDDLRRGQDELRRGQFDLRQGQTDLRLGQQRLQRRVGRMADYHRQMIPRDRMAADILQTLSTDQGYIYQFPQITAETEHLLDPSDEEMDED